MDTPSLWRMASACASHSSVSRLWYNMLIIASPLTVVRKFTWNSFLRSVSLASISASSLGMSSLIFSLPMGKEGTSTGVFGSSLSNMARNDFSPSCHTLNSARMRKCDRADSNTSVSGKGTSRVLPTEDEDEEDAAKCARARSIFASSSSRYVSGRTATSRRARVVCHCQWFPPERRRGRAAGAVKRRRTPPPQSAAAGFDEPERNRAVDARRVAARTCTCARIVSADPTSQASRVLGAACSQ
mmetsp:Transcript_10822/g.45431  ORF Transcript_10822/g.45431 Transcript_10822/m.45431 type:complete len:243 (-) Transcript_10822:13-741(-)